MDALGRLKSAVKASAASRYLCGRDDFVRHRAAARLLGTGVRTALDVGGEGLMAKFRRDVRFTTVNVKAACIVASAERLPFRDKSFDAAVSIDTLEHLPREIRTKAVAEMVRVARKRVVVAAPLGTPEHAEFERRLLDDLERSGARDTEYLAEHVRHGLPTPEDVEKFRRYYGGEVWYQGDFKTVSLGPFRYPRLEMFKQSLQNLKDDLAGDCDASEINHWSSNRFFITIEKHRSVKEK
jgi:hypothetical protein